jgi:hypothetical protein
MTSDEQKGCYTMKSTTFIFFATTVCIASNEPCPHERTPEFCFGQYTSGVQSCYTRWDSSPPDTFDVDGCLEAEAAASNTCVGCIPNFRAEAGDPQTNRGCRDLHQRRVDDCNSRFDSREGNEPAIRALCRDYADRELTRCLTTVPNSQVSSITDMDSFLMVDVAPQLHKDEVNRRVSDTFVSITFDTTEMFVAGYDTVPNEIRVMTPAASGHWNQVASASDDDTPDQLSLTFSLEPAHPDHAADLILYLYADGNLVAARTLAVHVPVHAVPAEQRSRDSLDSILRDLNALASLSR